MHEGKPIEDEKKRMYDFSRIILDGMPDAISIIDAANYRIVGANRAFLKEHGFSEEADVKGRTCYDVTHRSSHACMPPNDICPLGELLETGKHLTVEHIHYNGDGNRIYVEVRVSPLRDDQGTIRQVIHISRDITERKRAEEAMMRSEETFRTLFETSLDGIYWTDGNGSFMQINQAGAEMLGHSSPEEMIGRPAADYWLDPEDRKAFVSVIRRSKMVKGYLMTARKPDGTVIELEATSRVIEDEEGSFLGIKGSLRDVSARNRADRELRDNQQEIKTKHDELQRLFRQVELVKKEWELSIDCTADIILVTDGETKIRRCNKTARDFFGKSYTEIIKQDWADLLSGKGLVNEQMTNLSYGEAVELFQPVEMRWFMLQSYSYEDAALKLRGQVLVLRDITEMKNMTDALEVTNLAIETNRLKLQTALDELSHIIQQVTQKKDFSIRFINPNLCRCSEVMDCARRECPSFESEDLRCWQTTGTFSGRRAESIFASKFGNCTECAVYRLATSDPAYLIGENFNNMMHILELQHNELEKAYNDLKVAQSQITQQEKMASIGQLAAGVAHEINNPTGFIMSNIGSLERYMAKIREFLSIEGAAVAELPAERQEAVTQARKTLKIDFIMEDLGSLIRESQDGAERIKKIVQDLKSFSRVDEAEQKMADINAGLESTLNIVWNELKYKSTVHKEYGDIPRTKCNPGQLNQVFMNMLVNAAHAIEKQGEIGIRTWADNGSINIEVTDTGCGISAEKITRIFEPFYTTKEVGKGTGLGLSIAYDIVKKHKGAIEVMSEVGKGTRFTVNIPVVEG